MKSFKNLFHLLLFTALFSTCKKEDCPPCQDETNPKCENYNPCWDKKTVTADFEMGGYRPGGVPEYVPEWSAAPAHLRGNLSFKAIDYDKNDTSTKYTWLLGSEVIKKGTFTRYFGDTKENDIPITLIIDKKPDTLCFPNDDGKDTLSKTIHFLKGACEFLTSGDFKVLFDGYKDSVIVGVRAWSNGGNSKPRPVTDTCYNWRLVYIGFDPSRHFKSDTNWQFQNEYKFYSTIIFRKSPGQFLEQLFLNGQFVVNPETWEVEAEYDFGFKTDVGTRYHFKGRKIR